jgi:excisionase family DNA binding protein
MTDRLLYRRIEAAEALGLSIRTIDFVVAKQLLRVRRIGRRVLIPKAEIERFAKMDHSSGLWPKNNGKTSHAG